MTRVALPGPVRLATHAMGTRFELVLVGDDPPALRAAGEAAIEVIEETHRRFTRFESSSLLAHLGRSARRAPVVLDADSFRLFALAREVWVASAGAFDPAWDSPGPGFEAVELDPAHSSVRLHADLRLDFGAIAKGHGLDLAARTAREAGVTSGFLHGGTSSGIAIGTPPGRSGWRVRLGSAEGAPVVSLADRAFGFSASMRHDPAGPAPPVHVVPRPRGSVPADPSPRTTTRAAVVGPSAALADAWATALVAGAPAPRLGAEWLIWIDDAGSARALERA